MTDLLCRNRVEDFDRWIRVFRSHAEAHKAAGLRLGRLWRDTSDPSNSHYS